MQCFFVGNISTPLLLLVLDVLHAYLNSCHRYQQYTRLLHLVTSRKGQLGLCNVISFHTMCYSVWLILDSSAGQLLMDSSDTEDTSLQTDCECLEDGEIDSWDARPSMAINQYVVFLRREQEVSRSEHGCLAALQRWREEFLAEYEFPEVEVQSIVNTPEAHHLRRWCPSVASCLKSSCCLLFAQGSQMSWTCPVSVAGVLTPYRMLKMCPSC